MAQRIPKDFINLLISRANIVDIIGSHLNLQKKGNDYWACCPFHNEKTASFSVSESKQFYYCFGCHAKGNIFNFLKEKEGLSFQEAVKSLSEKAGLNHQLESFSKSNQQSIKNTFDIWLEPEVNIL